jgi:hypothetical protein
MVGCPREEIMNLTSSSSVLVLFMLAACGGKVPIGADLPPPSGGGAGSTSMSTTGSGGGGGGSGSQNDPALCARAPARTIEYTTLDQLDTLLVRRWQRCLAPQLEGEDVGVEFTADGHYYPLARDAAGGVVRLMDTVHTGSWTFYPVGAPDPISHAPATMASIELNQVFTNAPGFTEDPFQMNILFSPVPSRYIPLDP